VETNPSGTVSAPANTVSNLPSGHPNARAAPCARPSPALSWLSALRRALALACAALALAREASAASWALVGNLGAHDPTIIKEGNTWWVFSTGPGLQVKFSPDGLNWTQGVQIFASELSWWRTYAPTMGQNDVWAPDVHLFAGRYWCYYCVSEFGTNNSAIGLTSCSSIALGDWRDDGLVLSSESGAQAFNALDPDLSIDASGNPWLVFGSYFDGIHVVKLDPSMMKPTGTMYSIAARPNGVEGTNIVFNNGYYYLFASIDMCCQGVNSTYKIAYGRSAVITGPYADQSGAAMLSGGGTVLDSSGPRWIGPGGESVYHDPTGWIIAFHAYDAQNNGNPTLQISDLYWSPDNWPTFTAPAVAAAPAFTTQPISVTVTGGTVALDAVASNSPGYQWMLNGSAVPGATSPVFVTSDASSAAGTYTCVATNSAGSATSNPAVIALTGTTDLGRLSNLSCRASVGTGASVLIAGFAVGGAGTSGPEPVLVRASGPALAAAPFGVPGTLADPQLQIDALAGTTPAPVASNSGWGGSAAIASSAASVGAFSWGDPSSKDSAVVTSLPAGPYTAEISGASGDTGVALAEVYDARPQGAYTASSARLVNLSARVEVGTGGNVLIAGLVIGGSAARTVLVRASGPAIAAAPFDVPGTLPDPVLTLNNLGTRGIVATNSAWGGDPEVTVEAASVGAFRWSDPSSSDSALLVTLPPGNYTATVSGAANDTGVALVEVYEVP
jgi:arabinan endo-1,5-alpha-L-arabinosidase